MAFKAPRKWKKTIKKSSSNIPWSFSSYDKSHKSHQILCHRNSFVPNVVDQAWGHGTSRNVASANMRISRLFSAANRRNGAWSTQFLKAGFGQKKTWNKKDFTDMVIMVIEHPYGLWVYKLRSPWDYMRWYEMISNYNVYIYNMADWKCWILRYTNRHQITEKMMIKHWS